MKRIIVTVLLTFFASASANAQAFFKETFNYPNDGGLVDCSFLSVSSPYYPVLIDSVGYPNWINGATASFDGPVLVETGPLSYPGYSLSGVGKKVYLPTITTSPRQSARRIYPAQSGKVYFSMMVKLQEQYKLGTMVNGILVDKTTQDLNGTTIACINTSTSSSGIRGLLVFNRADTIGGVNYGKVIAGVSYKRDDVATNFASAKKLDTLQTYLLVVCTDPSTAKTSLWINPDLTGTEPAPDVSCTNADGAEVIAPIYFTIYQRSGYPSGWIGGISVAASWNALLGPEFSVNKSTIDFDSLVVGLHKKDSIIITNSGSTPLTISSIISTNSVFTVTPTSALINAGAKNTFIITATLDSAKDRFGKIVFAHNGATISDTLSVAVHPLPTPTFSFSKKQIDFGTLAVGAQKTDSVFVTNNGTANLVISSITSSSSVFSIAPTTASILPAQQQKFVVTAKLDSAKNRQGKIIFTHNGLLTKDTLTVSLTSLTGVAEDIFLPTEFKLHQNYPNPFNPTTTIRFAIVKQGLVFANIFDVLGRRIATLVDKEMPAGNYSVQWNASDFGSGLYFCRLQSGSNIQTIKLMLMK
ncbi:MAG: choice-of-anchor D domain-containing protein [Bacteroidota bacterium]|nr:choice-of-anchor D domain-containing protein [Bacteroidota bacterium]